MNNQNQQLNQNKKPKPASPAGRPKWLVLVTVVIGVIVIGLIAWGGYELFKSSSLLKGPEGFADWKTYRNEEYGFEVKYPADWDYKGGEGDSIGSFWKGDNVVISNSAWWRNLDIQGESFEEAVKNSESRMFLIGDKNVLLSFKKIIDKDKTIGFLSEWEVTIPEGNIIYEAIGDFEDKTQTPIITEGGPYKTVISFILIFDTYKKEFDQILSTFKFLD